MNLILARARKRRKKVMKVRQHISFLTSGDSLSPTETKLYMPTGSELGQASCAQLFKNPDTTIVI